MSQQTELALVHRLMRDLDSVVLPGQHDLQKAAMLALSALAQNIKLRYTIAELQTELGKTKPQLSVVRTNSELAN
jgi:hypothetical protein